MPGKRSRGHSRRSGSSRLDYNINLASIFDSVKSLFTSPASQIKLLSFLIAFVVAYDGYSTLASLWMPRDLTQNRQKSDYRGMNQTELELVGQLG